MSSNFIANLAGNCYLEIKIIDQFFQTNQFKNHRSILRKILNVITWTYQLEMRQLDFKINEIKKQNLITEFYWILLIEPSSITSFDIPQKVLTNLNGVISEFHQFVGQPGNFINEQGDFSSATSGNPNIIDGTWWIIPSQSITHFQSFFHVFYCIQNIDSPISYPSNVGSTFRNTG
jgi:hypothetical protein